MAVPHGGGNGKGGGYFFWPYKGAEVVVGFINNDPREAIVLGSLFSAKNPPPEPVKSKITDKNEDKGIYAQEGMSIAFNEKEKSINIMTSEGQYIKMSEQDSLIEIKDVTGNMIQMNDKGITITSKGIFKVDASSDAVTITGDSIDIN